MLCCIVVVCVCAPARSLPENHLSVEIGGPSTEPGRHAFSSVQWVHSPLAVLSGFRTFTLPAFIRRHLSRPKARTTCARPHFGPFDSMVRGGSGGARGKLSSSHPKLWAPKRQAFQYVAVGMGGGVGVVTEGRRVAQLCDQRARPWSPGRSQVGRDL